MLTAVSPAGGPDNQVHFEGYQVSNQCMALVRDECLLPCKDAPELGYAKESSSEQYVPDVFYKVTASGAEASSGQRMVWTLASLGLGWCGCLLATWTTHWSAAGVWGPA